jgi:Kef-type K+ transport system membrane component KefB
MHSSPDPFLLQLLYIFLAAKICGEMFERLKLPAVLGEILAGVALGPYGLTLIHPVPAVESIASIGAIFLLFGVGLETHPKDLIGVGRNALTVAIAGVALPFAAGFAFVKMRAGANTEATFIATAMVATSVGITARVMSDLDVLNTRAAKIILAAAVFDDVLGMVLLAMVAGFAAQGEFQWLQLGLLAFEAAAFAVFMIFVAPRVIHRMRPGVERLSTRNAPLIISLCICMALSLAAENIGMAAIVGAFFAGLAFAEYAPEWNLRPRIGAITEFLAPFFFFLMGSRLNLRELNGPLLYSALALTVLAFLTKLLGCGLPVLAEGWRTSLKVGLGMVPRGEVGLIVALIGLNSGFINQSTYAEVVLMIAATTLIAPPLLRHLFSEDTHFGVTVSRRQATASDP